LTLLVRQQEGHLACKKYGGWWRWALVTSLDGMAPIRMVGVSASVNLFLHHKVQKLSSGTSAPWWSWKNGHKMVVVVDISIFFVTFCITFVKSIVIAVNKQEMSHTRCFTACLMIW